MKLSHEWQEADPDYVYPPGCEYKMNMTDMKTLVRLRAPKIKPANLPVPYVGFWEGFKRALRGIFGL